MLRCEVKLLGESFWSYCAASGVGIFLGAGRRRCAGRFNCGDRRDLFGGWRRHNAQKVLGAALLVPFKRADFDFLRYPGVAATIQSPHLYPFPCDPERREGI